MSRWPTSTPSWPPLRHQSISNARSVRSSSDVLSISKGISSFIQADGLTTAVSAAKASSEGTVKLHLWSPTVADTNRDALQRHELTHQVPGPSLLSKGSRACAACATAKTRCTGETPCSRCQQRGVQCAYPDLVAETQTLVQNAMPSNDAMQIDQIITTPAIGYQPFANTLPAGVPLPFTSPPFDPDYWDPNILSTTNWLDAVIDENFQGLQYDFSAPTSGLSNTIDQVGNNNILYSPQVVNQPTQLPARVQVVSPVVTSDHSVRSGGSTETAAEICAAQDASTHSVGEYYVDGEPARLPRTKRRKLSPSGQVDKRHSSSTSTFSLRLTLAEDTDLAHRIQISDSTYETFCAFYQSTSVQTPWFWEPFEATSFPSKEIFEHLVGLYFAQFHQTLPFLHPPTFDGAEAHPLLLLAMASIGAHFFEDGASTFASSLSELLRRNLLVFNEKAASKPVDALTMAQVRVLGVVSLTYSGDARLVSPGLDMGRELATAFRDLVDEMQNTSEVRIESAEGGWRAFVREEQLGRSAYCVWMLDCMRAYQFQQRPLLSLSDTVFPLPCHEKYWRASTAEEWEKLFTNYSLPPSLQDALQELYIDKKLPRDRGEFARIIMIHGLFQRTWEVERYLSNPLSHWAPTAKRQSSKDILPAEPISLLSLPAYTKWQNSVCDCIDILHWQANATIGQERGLEHPTVAFLHLSRVVLLTPINTIVRYAKNLANGNTSTSSHISSDKKSLQQWATQGQFKSRLSAIHAGVVLWHVRRYSIDAFYEATAVALSVLMLWAFGTFAPRQASKAKSGSRRTTNVDGSGADSSMESSDDLSCGIILLDRPTDDELVQQFIRKGHTMRAHITGVGDLYGPQGPQRVLSEGCKLLQSLKWWGVSETWLDILQQLYQKSVSV